MEGLNLKPLSLEYLEWARLLHNEPTVLNMLIDPRYITEEEQLEWFTKLQQSFSSERWVSFHNEVPFGVVRLDSIDYSNKSVCIGLDIHKDYRGLGLAKFVYFRLFDKFFIQKSFNRLWLLVAEYNVIALHLYRGLGFKKEGVQKESLFRQGKYYDCIMMSILREEYNDNSTL